MPAIGYTSLSKGEVMMYLALAGLNRKAAANEAGVSEGTFRRYMRRYRIKAPRSNAKLTVVDVKEIRLLLEKHSRVQVAKIKGVHRRTIDMIADRETWLHVDV